jgi:hypothetical protein
LIDVSTETTQKLGPAFARAAAEIEAASYTDRRRLAGTSDDEAILAVLGERASASGDYDDDMVQMLLENEHTPLIALEKIAASMTSEYASEVSQMTDKNKDDLELTLSERDTLSVMRHRNADASLLAFLSKHPSWKIRYGVAMQAHTTEETLKELTEDQNLAVRVMALKRLGLPAVDDALGMRPNCAELNQTFEKIRRNILSSKKTADTLAKQFKDPNDNDRFDYSGADQFHRSCVDALKELKTRAVHLYVSRVRAKHLPNLDLSDQEDALPTLMDAFDATHFDAYIIVSALVTLIAQRAVLSLSELKKNARDLLPYVNYNNEHGPACQPEQILDGKRLKLRAYFNLIGEYSSIDSKILAQVEALDQLSTVVLTNADPATVKCEVAERLHYRRGADIFRKISVGDGASGLVAIRFFKNGNFIAEYASSEEAEKVAKALVTPPSLSNSEQGGNESER